MAAFSHSFTDPYYVLLSRKAGSDDMWVRATSAAECVIGGVGPMDRLAAWIDLQKKLLRPASMTHNPPMEYRLIKMVPDLCSGKLGGEVLK